MGQCACCYTCIKYSMFIFNFIFWLFGCALIGVGIWIRVDPNIPALIEEDSTYNRVYLGAYVLISVGVTVMIIGFLGCCGAARENQCMLTFFFIFLLVIFVLLLASIIYAVVNKHTLQVFVATSLEKMTKSYYNDTTSKHIMDNIQINFKCCGASKGGVDYMIGNTIVFPESCRPSHTFTPCAEKIFSFIDDNVATISTIGVCIGLDMIVSMVFAMVLCCAQARKRRKQAYDPEWKDAKKVYHDSKEDC